MTDQKSLDQAAEEYCDKPRCAKITRDGKTWHRMKAAFKAGAEWMAKQSAPQPVEPINNLVHELSRGLSTNVDAGILEEVISLFNSGVLKLYATTPRHEFNQDNMHLTVSQCVRVQFEGKEKIKELEAQRAADRAALQKAVEALEKIDQECSRHDTTAWSIASNALEEINNSGEIKC